MDFAEEGGFLGQISSILGRPFPAREGISESM
jgi:hypothetical protein